jgi:hypothetical protein
MESKDFKERQSAFEFFCARTFEYIKQFAKDCRAGWKELFKPKTKFINKTLLLNLDFLLSTISGYKFVDNLMEINRSKD